MKFLIDKGAEIVTKKAVSPLVLGQLLTPLTRYSNWGGIFAMDNGGFSGFRHREFQALLTREAERREQCLFVTIPDVVGAGRRTLEIWQRRAEFVPSGWRLALVAQNGMEDMSIPWAEFDVLFIGGGDPWKDSKASQDLVRTAKILGKHVHIGRVNTPERFKLFDTLGADTCDGSGVSMYDHMLEKIEKEMKKEPEVTLFDGEVSA